MHLQGSVHSFANQFWRHCVASLAFLAGNVSQIRSGAFCLHAFLLVSALHKMSWIPTPLSIRNLKSVCLKCSCKIRFLSRHLRYKTLHWGSQTANNRYECPSFTQQISPESPRVPAGGWGREVRKVGPAFVSLHLSTGHRQRGVDTQAVSTWEFIQVRRKLSVLTGDQQLASLKPQVSIKAGLHPRRAQPRNHRPEPRGSGFPHFSHAACGEELWSPAFYSTA